MIMPLSPTNSDSQLALTKRPRRLRRNPSIRSLVSETKLTVDDLIYPMFVMEGENQRVEIVSMPGCYRYSLDLLLVEIAELYTLGVKAVALFPVVSESKKDDNGTESYNPAGLAQQAVTAIKAQTPGTIVITDVALDPFTTHGHDGVIDQHGVILNDQTVEILVKMAVSQAQAGCDMVAPSDMMDGRIGAIRRGLDANGFTDVAIMAYSAKYASAYYGPFREALTEIELDIAEGADIVMVKPALAYLDIIHQVKANCNVPVAAYNVSGEYSMIKAAAQLGWIDEQKIVMETLLSIKRAGADLILTYFAKDVALILQKK